MKYFVSISSDSTRKFAEITNSPSIDYFGDFKIKDNDYIPNEYMNYFYDADAIVLNGTWGNTLRKELYLPNDFSFEKPLSELGYKQRSAILDVLNSYWVDLAKKYDKKIVVFESNTISRAENNYRETDHKGLVRISLDSWIYDDGKWMLPKHFQTPRKINAERLYDHSWNVNENGFICILTGLETDPTSTIPTDMYLNNCIKTIRKHTNRKIKIKVHPASNRQKDYQYLIKKYKNIRFLSSNQELKELYEDMYCAVIDNSTSIFELIDAGIPTYCSEKNFGQDLNNIDLNTINNPYLASKEEISKWVDNMVCTEVPRDYFDDCRISYCVETLIKAYDNGL